MAAYWRRSGACWLDDLHGLLAAGFPVALLMHYGPTVQPGVRASWDTDAAPLFVRSVLQ